MNRFQSKKEFQTTEDMVVTVETPTADVVCLVTPIIAHKRKEVSQCPEVQAVKRFIKAL
ncbi:hypothetical protein ABGL55_000149 [Shigella boydii]|jgi:hypothetical protein